MAELGSICWKSASVEELVRVFTVSQLTHFSSRNTLLLMGTTNSGKTTTVCYLAKKELRLTSETMEGLDGWNLEGLQVLDTAEIIENFKIGHTNESTTKSFHTCDVPGTDFIIADSCGFGDSEGILVDITNAISLRNGMISCASIRPVFVVDIHNLSTDKGASFSKLLNLIGRFFVPLDKYIESMSFLFTHCDPHDNETKILTHLTSLSKASQILENPVSKDIVSYIFKLVRKYGSRTILYPSEMTSENHEISAQSVLSMIIEAPVITELNGLGNPLSTEAVTSIRDKCIECRVLIMDSTMRHFYEDAEEKMSALKSLDEYMRIDEVREQFDLALESIEESLDTLVNTARADLVDCKYDKLAPLLKQLGEAKCLSAYKDVREEYSLMLTELDGLVNQLAQEVLARSPTDVEIVFFMDKLHEVHRTLSEYINSSSKQAYDRVRMELEDHYRRAQSDCFGFLQALRNLVYNDVLPDGWCIRSTDSGFTQKVAPFLENLAKLSTAKKIRIFRESTMISEQYDTLVREFCDQLVYIKSVLLHYGGLLCLLESGKLSGIQSAQLTFLYDLVHTSVLCGLANHTLDESLVSLPADVTAAVRSALLAHYQTVQERLNHNQFIEIQEPLQQLGLVHLHDADFIEFQCRLTNHAVQLVSERLFSLYDVIMKTSMHLADRETADFSDYEKLVRDLFLLRSGTCLDALLASALTCKSVSVMCSELLLVFCSDWSRRCNELSSSVLQGDMRGELVKRFVRLDCMLPLEQVVHTVPEDVAQAAYSIEHVMQSTLSSELEAEQNTAIVLEVLKSLDVWEDLCNCLSTSHLLKLSSIESLLQYTSVLQRKRGYVGAIISKRLIEAKDRIHTAFSERSAVGLNTSLNVVRDCCVLDDYINPKASTMYLQLRTCILECMRRAAEVASSYGEADETNRLRVFFETSDLFAHHFEGLADMDFQSMARDLMSRHRMSAEKIAEEVKSLLSHATVPFDLIREKLLSVMQVKEDREWDPKDKSIFAKCEREVSKYLGQLESSCSDCDSMAEEDAVHSLTIIMRIAVQAMVLKDILVTYDPVQVLQLVVDAIVSLYSKIEGKAKRHLSQWRFEAASEAFQKLLKFNKIIVPQAYSDFLHCDEHESNFRQRNKDFLYQYVRPLQDDIIQTCRECLGEHPSGRQDFDKLFSIISRVDSAVRCEHGLFDEEVEFVDIRCALVHMVYEYGVLLNTQFREAVDRSDLEGARLMNRNMGIIGHLSDQFMEPTKSSRITKYVLSQTEDLRSMEDIDPIRTFDMTPTSVRNMHRSLKQLQHESFAKHCEMLRKVSDLLRERMRDFKPVALDSRPIEVFEFMKALWEYEATIGFQNDVACQRLLRHCQERFYKFLLSSFDAYKDRLKTSQDVEQLVTEATSFRDCTDSTCKFINETQFAAPYLSFLCTLMQRCNDLLSRAELVVAEIASCEGFFGSFDIFAKQNIEKVMLKLKLLEKQGKREKDYLGGEQDSSPVPTPVSSIFSILEGRIESMNSRAFDFISQKDYGQLSIGLFNLQMLNKCGRLQTICTSFVEEISRATEECSTHLLGKFRQAFVDENGFKVDELVGEAESLDKAFGENCPGQFEPLMTTIISEFSQSIDNLLATQVTHSSQVECHANILHHVKSFVNRISSSVIQQLAFRRIGDYLDTLASSRAVDLFALGMALHDLGPLGREITEAYSQFKSIVTKRFNSSTAHMTMDHALNDIVHRNPTLSSSQKDELKMIFNCYESFYEHNLRSYLAGYNGSFNVRPLSGLVNAVIVVASVPNPSKSVIVEALAGVFAVFTITNSQDMFRESQGDRECLMKPHAVQLLTIFRLLGLDKPQGLWNMLVSYLSSPSSRLFDGHLAQVGTGEGKSILLGGLSCLLALMGYEVYCASYSKYLSHRDYSAFEKLFTLFGVEDRVHYSTLDDLVETVINRDGNMRSKIAPYILNDGVVGQRHSASVRRLQPTVKRILLIDEVDVFFNDNFFGSTYNSGFRLNLAGTVELLTYVWRNNNASLSLQHLQLLPEYTELLAKFHTAFKPVVEKAVSFMIEDVKDFANPPYVVVDGPRGKLIGYKKLDSVSTTISFRYKTAFAYLHESTTHAEMRKTLSNELGLLIKCGKFSYAEVPKIEFDCIMGVSGTLDSLSTDQNDVIKNDYKINQITIAPSMYGDSKLAHKKDTGVVMEDDEARYHQTIAKDITDERDKGRSVLVFFESESELQTFVSSEYGARLTDVNIVTEKTNNVDFFVNKATVSGAVTLFPRVFGRGLDFRVRDAAVDDAGGVHVIQTFFSECTSEEIQIKGRTARQAKKGSYKLILLRASLEGFGFTCEELSEIYHTSSFYDNLSQKREVLHAKHISELKEEVVTAKVVHDKSMGFLALLDSGQCTSELVASNVMYFQS